MFDLKDDRWIKNCKQIRPIENRVVLTFDDGPSRYLKDILDILKDRQIQALFFWQSRLLYNERPWKKVLMDGHQIGTHSHNHKNLAKLDRKAQYWQINTSIKQIKKITDKNVQYFRPPFGQYNEDTMSIINELNLVPIMWEISSYDWSSKDNLQRIITNVVEHSSEGSIILLHELEQTLKALPELIDQLRGRGFEFTLL